jgi:hypothetical protein
MRVLPPGRGAVFGTGLAPAELAGGREVCTRGRLGLGGEARQLVSHEPHGSVSGEAAHRFDGLGGGVV